MTAPANQKSNPRPHMGPGRVALWVAIAVALLLVQLWPGRSLVTAISYSEFSRQLSLDTVARVEVVTDAGEIRGDLRRALALHDTSVTAFRVDLPFTDAAPLVTRLEEHGVPIVATKRESTWLTMLVSLVPWILLIGFWWFISRQA